MRPGPRATLFALCLLLVATVPPVAGGVDSRSQPHRPQQVEPVQPASQNESSAHPSIAAVYPDPIADGDAGEFVVLDLPRKPSLAGYTLTDGDATIPLGNVTARGRVALTNAPDRTRNRTDATVVSVDRLELANGGERLRIRQHGTVVDRAVYRDTEEGHLATWNGSRIEWRPIGATDWPPIRANGGEVRAFVLPDSPSVPISTIRNTEDRLLLAGYTLTAERVADALVAAHERNVTVRVLLEGKPVGGRSRQGARLLDRLVKNGIEVRVVGGPHARYDYHHAKYAVADDRAIVLTENWKPAGTGGHSSRGWGAVTNQSAVVDGLAGTFRADAGWDDAISWSRFRRGRSFETGEASTATYDTRFESQTVPVDSTTLLVTPDNAQGALVDTLDRADDSIDVIQVTVGWESQTATALRRAAKRGVRVRLLLSSAWYVREDNRRLAERFREWAGTNDASLSVRLADPDGRYGKIHAKGAIVDDDTVLLGSLNWNEQAATQNREVVLGLRGQAVADYYGAVFDADWQGGRDSIPYGLVAAVLGCLCLAAIVGGKIRFER